MCSGCVAMVHAIWGNPDLALEARLLHLYVLVVHITHPSILLEESPPRSVFCHYRYHKARPLCT